MPTVYRYVPAEVILVHKGVTVYHVYKDDDRDGVPREYGFDTQEDSQDECSYDVREIADKLNVELEDGDLSVATKNEFTESVIRLGIEKGLITAS